MGHLGRPASLLSALMDLIVQVHRHPAASSRSERRAQDLEKMRIKNSMTK